MAPPRFKASRKAMQRVERIYGQRCHGVQIAVLDIDRVFQCGYAGIAAGDNDEQLGDRIAAFVDTIRTN